MDSLARRGGGMAPMVPMLPMPMSKICVYRTRSMLLLELATTVAYLDG